MKRLVALLVLVPAVLAMLAVSNGCIFGDGEGLSLKEYFQRVDDLQNATDADIEALDAQLEALEPPDLGEQGPGIIQEEKALADEFIGALNKLEPPSEVEAAHNEALQTLRSASAAFDEAIDQLDKDAASVDDFFAPFASEELAAAFDRQAEACVRLEEVARDNSIDVDLNCHNE